MKRRVALNALSPNNHHKKQVVPPHYRWEQGQGLRLVRLAHIGVLILAALLTCRAQETNLVTNSGFEAVDAQNQVVGWQARPPVYRFAEGVGRNGSRALYYDNQNPKYYHVPSQRIQLEPGALYEFEVWVKTEKIEGPETGASICVEWSDNGKYLGGSYAPGIRGTHGAWQRIHCITTPIASNATSFSISPYVRRGMTGKAWFDDLSIKRYYPPLVQLISVSNYRRIADQGLSTFSAVLALDSQNQPPQEVRGEFTWEKPDGTVVLRRAPQSITPKRAYCTLDVTSLPLGDYTVRFKLFDTTKRVRGEATTTFSRVEKLPERTVYIDDHNRLIVDHKPFFPLGMYWSGLGGKERELATYAQGPFNCLMPYGAPNPEQMNECQRLGLHVIYSIKDFFSGTTYAPRNMTNEAAEVAEIERRVKLIGKHPALLAWYINDELPLSMVQRLAQRQQLMEKLDPHHPTWVVLYQYKQIDSYLATFDVIGTDPYPLPNKPVGVALEWTRSTRDLSFNTRALWQVPQAFDWGAYRKGADQSKTRAPTLAEMRTMTWQCIAAGANGLVYYSFFDLHKMNWRDPFDNRWRDMCAVATEVKEYIPVILSVEPTPQVTVNNPTAIETRLWRTGNKVYLLAVNGSTYNVDANLQLSEKFTKSTVAFGPPAVLTNGDSLKVTLSPLEPLLLCIE